MRPKNLKDSSGVARWPCIGDMTGSEKEGIDEIDCRKIRRRRK
jgi:hypothetical protein